MKYKPIKNDQLILTLELTENEIIQIYADDKIELIDPYSYTSVIFHKNNQLYLIEGGDFLYPLQHFLWALQKLLKKSLSYNLKLDDSITHDIGYLWNIWINGNDTSLARIIKNKNYPYWIGQEYELSCGKYISWIYNDEQSNIIFEITPAYPQYVNQENEIEVKDYQNWMKSYKPLLITIISEETAQQWLKQAETILEEINKNMEKRIAAREI